MHQAHDRAFVVAGAKKEALLEDFQKAIDDALAKGLPFKGFKDKDGNHQPGFLDRFDEIVARHGWSYNGGRDWRARVIYETNLKTAYAAGRYKQMTEPDVLKIYPYWQYVHGLRRVPDEPRLEHLGWDGLILRADDPWWLTYYPPNGWKCGCGVRPVSARKLRRLGKTGPDSAPPIILDNRTDPGTGELIDYPKGIDIGWAYAPGRTWADGLVPRELQQQSGRQLSLPRLDNLVPSTQLTKPFKTDLLPDDQSEEFYVSEFLKAFGARVGIPKLIRDKAGQVILVSDALFHDARGEIKVKKRGRQIHVTRLAETILDPDEIWVDWEWHRQKKQWILKRRYLRLDADTSDVTIFEFSNKSWAGVTALNSKPAYIENQRRGSLLYRRPQDGQK